MAQGDDRVDVRAGIICVGWRACGSLILRSSICSIGRGKFGWVLGSRSWVGGRGMRCSVLRWRVGVVMIASWCGFRVFLAAMEKQILPEVCPG